MSESVTPKTTEATEKRQALTAYQVITDQFVKALDGGTVPWQRKFKLPQNMVSNKEYQGRLNRLLLSLNEFTSPYYLTFRQVLDKEGKIKEGEKGSFVTWWKKFEKMSDGSLRPVKDDEKKQEIAHVDDDKASQQTDNEVESNAENVAEVTGTGQTLSFLRYYKVFNVPAQTEGIAIPEIKVEPTNKTEFEIENEALDRALGFIDQLDVCPIIDRGTQPCYVTDKKEVWMPPETNYPSIHDWCHDLFHEVAHAADHALGRKDMGSQMAGYAYGELVAEMSASFLCNDFGLMDKVNMKNSQSYVAGWAAKLKSDPKMVVLAASRAQKVCRLLKHEITIEQSQTQKQNQEQTLKTIPSTTQEEGIITPTV